MPNLDQIQIIDLRTKLVNYSLLALSASIALQVFLYTQHFSTNAILAFFSSVCFAGACGFSIGNVLKLFDDQKDWLADFVEKHSSDWRGWYLFLFGMGLLMLNSLYLLLMIVGIIH